VISAIAVGRQPPRPRPARKRRVPKTTGPGAKAHSSVNAEKDATAPMRALRRPITSVRVPMVSAPTVIPSRPTVVTSDALAGVRPQGR
jgi:hypothetical protein